MPVDLPTSLPPSRDDKATFAQRGNDAWAHLFGAWPQLNALEANVNSKEASATTSANTATTKAGEALTSANAAATSKAGADAARDAAVAARAAAEAALDSFDDRYLGPKAVAPTLDNDGNALIVGAIYFDTAIGGGSWHAWNGTAWVTAPAANASVVLNTPAGTIAATTVQAAINELDTEKAKAGANSDITSLSALTSITATNAAGSSTALSVLKNSSAASASNIVQEQFFAANSFGGLEQIASITAINPNATGNNGGALYFSTSANGTATTPTERMRIDATGANFTGALQEGGKQTYNRGNILGTVSQTAGVPTGAVIERGSNANGEYVRWADGTQMCWHTLPTFAVAANAGTAATWTFPAAFSVAPSVPAWSGSETITGDTYGFIANAGVTTTTAAQKFRNGGTAQDVSATRALAVGRWF